MAWVRLQYSAGDCWKGPFVAASFAEFDSVAGRMGDMAGAYASGERRRECRDHGLEWMVKSGGIEVVLAGLRNNTIRFPWPDPA
jgi:RNA polymerase-associated protein